MEELRNAQKSLREAKETATSLDEQTKTVNEKIDEECLKVTDNDSLLSQIEDTLKTIEEQVLDKDA